MKNILLFLIIILVFFNCSKIDRDWNNPYDPESDNYKAQPDSTNDSSGSSGQEDTSGRVIIISNDTTWNGTVIINKPIYVTGTATLTILPGTSILFSPETDLHIYGTLKAKGDSANWITFENRVKGIKHGGLLPKSLIELKYCIFRKLNFSIVGNVNTIIYATNCIFKSSARNGIRGSNTEAFIKNCDFINNNQLAIENIVSGVIDNCYIANNNGATNVTLSIVINDTNVIQQYNNVSGITNPRSTPNFP